MNKSVKAGLILIALAAIVYFLVTEVFDPANEEEAEAAEAFREWAPETKSAAVLEVASAY